MLSTLLTFQENKMEQLQWNLFFQSLPLVFLIGSLMLTGLAWLIWKKKQEKDFIPSLKALGASDKSLKEFYGWVPVILGVHVAVALLVNGMQGQLFSSHNPLADIWSNWLGLIEIMIALALFYGGLTRPAAILIGSLWLLGIDLIGVQPMMKSIQYLGFACFFYLAGRGPYAIDRLLFPILEPKENYISYALLFLRVGVGLNLVTFGFTEKFANISLAKSLLEKQAFLNFTNMPNEIFVLLVGSLEVLGGLLITLGIFPRTVALMTLICLNASLTIYNWNELIDCFPTYGALAILFVWDPSNSRQKLLWLEGLRKGFEGIDYENSA